MNTRTMTLESKESSKDVQVKWPVISTCDGVGLPQTIRTESRNHVIMMTIDRTSYSVSMIGVYKKVSTVAVC